MKDDSGLLSIDFIAGFTIFMVAFIIVITMVSGLLVSLQSRTIDYDALAYRAGVILTEDAGDPGGAGDLMNLNTRGIGWEIKNFNSTQDKKQIIRLGLALSKNYPNILSSAKVDKFFYNNNGFTESEYLNYRQKLMLYNFNNQYLSTTPTYYHFNIRFQSIENSSDIPKEAVPHITTPRVYNSTYIGEDDSNVQNYGYSRRVVKVKQPSSMNVNLSYPQGNPNSNTFLVQYDWEEFNSKLGNLTGLRYKIDPYNEQTAINVTLNNSISVELSYVETVIHLPNAGNETAVNISDTSPVNAKIYLNTNNTAGHRWFTNDATPIYPNSNVLIVFEPGFIAGKSLSAYNDSSISVRCTFSDNVTARDYPIVYSYTEWSLVNNSTWMLVPNPNLTMPYMIPAILEVKVW
jgi:hypothetical protein